MSLKNQNIAEKTPHISWNIAWDHQVLYMYGKREDQESQWWCQNLLLFIKFEL
jgi:hypothetical protein